MDWLIVIAGYFAAALACSALWFAAACIRLFFKERRHRLCRCACGCTRMDSPTLIAVEHEGYRHETERCFPMMEAI